MLEGERTIQSHFQDTHLLAARGKVFDGFLGGFGSRSHQDDDPLGIRRAHVVEEVIGTPHEAREFIHLFLDDGRAGFIERVHGLTRLEENVGVLGGAADEGVIRRQGAFPMRLDELFVNHGQHIFVG